jgi:2-polyprenyl-3-methyl-5-hydroxy-6-metoxy-1,4-benzoquinol methylase
MPDLSKRSDAIEIMDDLDCSGPVVAQTLRELEFINKWLGGNAITLDGLNKVLAYCTTPKLKVADLGCGGGDMLMLISRELKRKNIVGELIGIDANPNIISYAEKHTRLDSTIRYKSTNIFSEEFRNEKFDIVFATLFFHHFTREQLIGFFSHLKKVTAWGVVVNDLHRHPLAYYSIKLLTRLFSKSDMVKNDAPVSVHRGFTRAELKEILNQAGITHYALRWKWAFRWQLVIRTENSLA